ncbi:MAG: CRISPR-associated endonuclease Cas2 [Lachnospiraceae bacterium]
MSYRYMRIIVFFDLPTNTSSERREYSRFHKYLVKSGFLMMQESVYCKLALNTTVSTAIINNVRKNKPMDGLVQVLAVTEKQFSKMEYIVGENTSEVLDSDERLVIL